MLSLSVAIFSSLLSDYLKRMFRLDESIVNLQPLAGANGGQPGNKVHLFVVNLERETAGGIPFNRQSLGGGYHSGVTPAWQMNVYVMIAAAFQEKQYEEGLKLMSGVFSFLQGNNQFSLPGGGTLAVEPVNLSFHELSNLWSICGGAYYPSVVCKIRTLNVIGEEIKSIGRVIDKKEVGVNGRHSSLGDHPDG